MKERPILFSGPMVRALLAGTKTQTRRIVKARDLEWMDVHQGLREPDNAERCPYGQPGDRLWVREAHYLTDNGADEYAVYAADAGSARDHIRQIEQLPADFPADVKARHLKQRPSIHMPRWASRITLEVTGVRVERLQDISEADAQAEGCPCYVCGLAMDGLSESDCHCFHKKAQASDYRNLWEQINGPGSWDANPWVWVVEFKPVATTS